MLKTRCRLTFAAIISKGISNSTSEIFLFMKNIIRFATILLILLSNKVQAQTTLTLEEAINRALNQNFGIKVLQNDVKVLSNNAVKANAGFLPNVGLTASETPSFGYLNQKLSNGGEVNRSNVSNNLAGTIQLSWLLYDGKRMYLELDRLKELQGVGEISLRLRSEQLIYDVMRTYFNIVRQQELAKSLEDQLNLYEERLRLASTRLEVGKGNQLDVLQAQSDLSVQKTQLLRQKQATDIAKLQLSQLLTNSDASLNFVVKDSLSVAAYSDYNILKANLLAKNLNIALLKKQLGISTLLAQEAESQNKPRVVLNSGFTLGRQDNTAGLFLVNQNTGLNAGVTLTYPLYDGGNIKRQVTNAKIEIESNKLRAQQMETDLVSSLNIAYQNYLNAAEILRGEENNKTIARQSIDIAMERFRLSRSTILELALIQQTYENAIFRSITAKFEAKMAEIDLLRLSGSLLR
jgi:outer membrane protein